MSNNVGEDQIIFFIEADEKVRDQLIVMKRRTGCGEIICILCHLGIVISNREFILFSTCKSNSRIYRSCMRLRGI
jgi:hypothetical protein